MRMVGLPIAVTLLVLLVGPTGAQEVDRSQDGFIPVNRMAIAVNGPDKWTLELPDRSPTLRMSPVGTFETCRRGLRMSAYGGRAEGARLSQTDVFDPKRTFAQNSIVFSDCGRDP
jgi:hypothetical protein